MIPEVFVPIKGYWGKYEISNYGRIKSVGRTVTRSDGVKRKVTERFILSDKSNVNLGMKNTCNVHQLAFSSFYSHYDSKKHILKKISDDLSKPILDRYEAIIRSGEIGSIGKRLREDLYQSYDDENKKAYAWFIQTLNQ